MESDWLEATISLGFLADLPGDIVPDTTTGFTVGAIPLSPCKESLEWETAKGCATVAEAGLPLGCSLDFNVPRDVLGVPDSAIPV